LGFGLGFLFVAGGAQPLDVVGVVGFSSVDTEGFDVVDVVELVDGSGTHCGVDGVASALLLRPNLAFDPCRDLGAWSAVLPGHQRSTLSGMSGDDALKVAAATWIVLMAIVAATISWVLCAAVVGGAGVALIERRLSRQV
jgi:hypothetical protein